MNTTSEELAALKDVEYSEKLRQELTTVAAQVEYILLRYPSARNSDTMLQWIWLRTFKGIKIPYTDYNTLMEISIESVRRIRQKFNEAGHFLPTDPEVAKRRKRKQAAMRRLMPTLDIKETRDYGESL